MAKIKSVHAYEIIDSRGCPTLEGQLTLDNGAVVTTSIPSGTSVGKHEAVELRDHDARRFAGMGVTRAVSYINSLIAPKLVGASPLKQQEIDYWLIKADGSKDKSTLGANTLLLVSQLILKAGAADQNLALFRYVNQVYKNNFKSDIKLEKVPSPIFNIINGGKHANNSLEFQEFQIIPSSSFSYTKAYEMGVELFHELKHVLKYRNANVSVGEEGGFTPNFTTNLDAPEVINETIVQLNLKPGLDVFIGFDIAASHFYKDDRYIIKDRPHPLKKEEYIEFLKKVVANYSVLIIEDPIDEDDWDGWKKFSSVMPDEIYIVGDDLLTTNKERLLKAIKEKACTTILIKPNQIGTITETLEVVDTARKNNFNYIVSHRSGETNDCLIADFAVGIQADFVKFGAPSRGERVAKYNRLWQIDRDELKPST
ncbi:MAG: phosphopyruvate hydratase [Candidatus Roizmanbacteria bacterium]|nr:MAG: phosphopyruvate hydratase [Candidatus Roizmanbacteria bacterium]